MYRIASYILAFLLIYYFLLLILVRIVKVLGRTKALEILYATEDIQEIGGMPTAVSRQK